MVRTVVSLKAMTNFLIELNQVTITEDEAIDKIKKNEKLLLDYPEVTK